VVDDAAASGRVRHTDNNIVAQDNKCSQHQSRRNRAKGTKPWPDGRQLRRSPT
jgi:hypothetical protein